MASHNIEPKDVVVVTTPTLPGRADAPECFGLVEAHFGESTTSALYAIQSKAALLGGNTIVGLQLAFNDLGRKHYIGTAVYYKSLDELDVEESIRIGGQAEEGERTRPSTLAS